MSVFVNIRFTGGRDELQAMVADPAVSTFEPAA
jgi:hypothetical protein